MTDRKYFYNVRCHACGQLADPEMWYDSEEDAEYVAEESEFLQIDGEWYCPECYEVDDNDNYVVIEHKKKH